MERLAGAILLQAIKDLESPKYRAEIRAFIHSEWFSELVVAAGLETSDPMAFRVQLETGAFNRISLRAAYR